MGHQQTDPNNNLNLLKGSPPKKDIHLIDSAVMVDFPLEKENNTLNKAMCTFWSFYIAIEHGLFIIDLPNLKMVIKQTQDNSPTSEQVSTTGDFGAILILDLSGIELIDQILDWAKPPIEAMG